MNNKAAFLQEIAGPAYAEALAVRDDVTITDLYNAPQAGIDMPVGVITLDQFYDWFALEFLDILAADEPLRSKWLGIDQVLVKPRKEFNISGPTADGLLQQLKADGILKDRDGFGTADEQIHRVRFRPGSPAERDQGRNVTLTEVSEALNEVNDAHG